jgi:hypothetical protein
MKGFHKIHDVASHLGGESILCTQTKGWINEHNEPSDVWCSSKIQTL